MKNVQINIDKAKEILASLPFGQAKVDLVQAILDAENPKLQVEELLPKMRRPICFFDIESTGTNVSTDRIVTLDILRLDPSGRTETRAWMVDPGVPIPAGATAIHGINDDDVIFSPSFCDIAAEIDNFLYGCDLGHFNGEKFDVPLLAEELGRCGIEFTLADRNSIDVSNIFRKKEPRSLGAAHEFYLGEVIEGAHDSEHDVAATFNVFLAQLKKYPDLFALSLEELAAETCHNKNAVDLAGKLYRNEEGEVCYSFGKHKDTPVLNEKSYADWMVDKGDFPADTKRHLMKLIPALARYEINKAKK